MNAEKRREVGEIVQELDCEIQNALFPKDQGRVEVSTLAPYSFIQS